MKERQREIKYNGIHTTQQMKFANPITMTHSHYGNANNCHDRYQHRLNVECVSAQFFIAYNSKIKCHRRHLLRFDFITSSFYFCCCCWWRKLFENDTRQQKPDVWPNGGNICNGQDANILLREIVKCTYWFFFSFSQNVCFLMANIKRNKQNIIKIGNNNNKNWHSVLVKTWKVHKCEWHRSECHITSREKMKYTLSIKWYTKCMHCGTI